MDIEKTSSTTSKRSRDERDHRKHHRSRDGGADERRSSKDSSSSDHHRHHHRSSDRDSKRERSHELPSRRDGDRERSHEPEAAPEGRQKRKERERSEDGAGAGDYDGGEKRARVSEEKKRERRRFGDRAVKVEEQKGENESGNGIPMERVKFEDRRIKEEEDGDDGAEAVRVTNGSGSAGNGATVGPLPMMSGSFPETALAPSHPLPTKVSSINTTHENKGVSSIRSHEVPGKSSTDGSSSIAGKSGSLTLDALAKAKKALQMQKELAEKMKKIPLLNKAATASSNSNAVPKPVPKEEPKQGSIPSTGAYVAPLSSLTAGASAASVAASSSGTEAVGLASIPNIEAVRRAQELAARMGFRQDPEFAPIINLFPGQSTATDAAAPQKPSKAPVLRLDALGREIDEHGNVVNVTKPSYLSTLKVNINKQKKEAFKIIQPELDVDPASNPHFDERMGLNKTKLLRPKKMSFQFVEEGRWSRDAENMKLRSKFGEAQAKELRAKQAQLAKAKAAPDINPNLIEVTERVIKEKVKEPIPEVEWWDKPLLRSGTYGYTAEGNMPEDAIKLEKMTIYVEHPRPIEPPAEPAPPPPQPLKLTKKEQKKLRTQKRLARERERQEMIRQGLIEPPKPKVKMSNLMKVLGSEATQDPTRLEKEIRSAAAEREQAHIDRNTAQKLTPAERREKKERKLFADPGSLETLVSVYRINDLSHPQTRFKVDVFARENRLTGCAVIADGVTVVVVEGGNKSIKRYGKVMLRRIDWAKAVKDEDEDDDDEKPPNKCSLVWQGSVAKPAFSRFTIHDCMTEAAARKIYADVGVGHYWDLAVSFTDEV